MKTYIVNFHTINVEHATINADFYKLENGFFCFYRKDGWSMVQISSFNATLVLAVHIDDVVYKRLNASETPKKGAK